MSTSKIINFKIVREGTERPRQKWYKFIEWFNWIIQESEFCDFRYPVKGTIIWRPYGLKVRRFVENYLRKLLEETGHEEVLFPTFIPYEFLAKESEHVRSFEKEVFWISKGGVGEERLILRPTSETAIMPMLKYWVRDHTDLPFKIYQIVNVFRAETKATHPMIRLREVSMFKEAHTVHADREDAERQVKEAVEIYRKFFDYLGIPYLISRRPEWDKFAGAVYTIAFDTLLPDGKTLQIGTVHYLGINFAKAFDIKYLKIDGTLDYVHTTSYGISERVIASLIAIHGDDRGLVLPPQVAPIQVVIIPIMYKGTEISVLEEARRVERELRECGFRVYLDDREEKTPGWKYYYWELKGVPLRIEIGPKDLEARQVVLVRRDNFEKIAIPREELIDSVKYILELINTNLKEHAWNFLKSRITRAVNIDDARKALNQGMIVHVPWCGDDDCGIKIQEILDADVLGVPIDEDPTREIEDLRDLACPEKRANYWIRLAKRY